MKHNDCGCSSSSATAPTAAPLRTAGAVVRDLEINIDTPTVVTSTTQPSPLGKALAALARVLTGAP